MCDKVLMPESFNLSRFQSRSFAMSPYIEFVFNEHHIRAHRSILSDRCDYFKLLFVQNKENIIYVDRFYFKLLSEVIKYCYHLKIDITHWNYFEKLRLYEFAKKYMHQSSLVNIVVFELEKRRKVLLTVENINELYKKRPNKELREWIKDNRLEIFNYEDCHKYSKDLVAFILDTFYDMEKNILTLRMTLRKQLQWLFRWRNGCDRQDEDVKHIFEKIRWRLFEVNLLPLNEKPVPFKIFNEVVRFWDIREVKTAGWTCKDVLKLLGFAYEYDSGLFLDAIVKVIREQYLHAASFPIIHDSASKLGIIKLNEVIIDYVRSNTVSILLGSESTNYSAKVVGFIVDCLKGHKMDIKETYLMLTYAYNWIKSKTEEEGKMVFGKIQDFPLKRFADLFDYLFNEDHSKDIIFVIDENVIKAHKMVLAYNCNYFKQLFDQNKGDKIKIDETSVDLFNEVIKYCYLQTISFTDWSYKEKMNLHNLAIEFEFQSLVNFVKIELNKRPKVSLSVESLDEWHQKRPPEEIREWIMSNILSIFDYRDCHKYSKELVIFVMETFDEMFDKENNKDLLQAPARKLIPWLFRWVNWSERKPEDVQKVFRDGKLTFCLNEGISKEIHEKLCDAVGYFLEFTEMITPGWTCDEKLQLLYFADDYDFGPLADAVINVVTKEHLEPASLPTIHRWAIKLKSPKLLQVLVDYLKSETDNIVSGPEFINYPASLVLLILENLGGQVVDKKVMDAIWKWKVSKPKEDVKVVFSKIRCQDFPPKKPTADKSIDVNVSKDVTTETSKIMEEVKEIICKIGLEAFSRKQLAVRFSKLFREEKSKDVTFTFGNQKIRAHKVVLTYSCNNFKQMLDHNNNQEINMNGTSFKPFNEVIKYCYLQTINVTDWIYKDKFELYALAKKYRYHALMDLLQIDLDKRPKVPISVESLNEWYEKCPDDEIRVWVKINLLNILNYEECHKYSKELVAFILDTFHMETNIDTLRVKLKKQLQWLFRWRNKRDINEVDVMFISEKIRWKIFELNLHHLSKRPLRRELFNEVTRFWRLKVIKTAGWTCKTIMEFLYLAVQYDPGAFYDSVANVIREQFMKPSTFAIIYDLASKLEISKLQEVFMDYVKNNTMNILSSTEFTNYPASVVGFIMKNVKSQAMDTESRTLMFTYFWNWMASKSAEEVEVVITKIHWTDFSRKDLSIFFENLFKDNKFKDITFLFDNQAIKAHKMVLSYSCCHFKQMFDQNQDERIVLDDLPVDLFNEVIKFCYLQRINITDWTYNQKKDLYNLATDFKYQSLMDFVKKDLEKPSEIPFTLESLDELYEKSSPAAFRNLVKTNLKIILSNDCCSHYSKNLVVFIMETFYNMYANSKDKRGLKSLKTSVHTWLSQWIKENRKEAKSVFKNIRWALVPSEQKAIMELVVLTSNQSPEERPSCSNKQPEIRGTKRRHE